MFTMSIVGTPAVAWHAVLMDFAARETLLARNLAPDTVGGVLSSVGIRPGTGVCTFRGRQSGISRKLGGVGMSTSVLLPRRIRLGF